MPYIWDWLTKGSDILAIGMIKKILLNGNDNFSDFSFLEEELKGKSTFGLNYEEFASLILGNSKVIR